MVKDEYKSGGGGVLKLKGAKNAGVNKKRKREKKAAGKGESGGEKEREVREEEEQVEDGDSSSRTKEDRTSTSRVKGETHSKGAVEVETSTGKTEAERRHEEIRKRRLDERLKREGLKTHKERVEELNKYLSTLSEHHDMPRIGPG